MDYLLAKELEEAGFPQSGQGGHVSPPDKIIVRREDRVYCPALSELIEACGAKIAGITRGLGCWFAYGGLQNFYIERKGATPEEAVARLWLALNKPA